MNKIDICNMALACLGNVRPISSLAEDTTESRLCDRFYETVRESMLMEFPWGFAKQSFVALTLATITDIVTGETTPETHEKYSYVYFMPDDCLRIMSVSNSVLPPGEHNEYEIIYTAENGEGKRRIVCDVPNAKAEYIVDLEDVKAYPMPFIEAFAWKLASMIAIGLSKDPKIAQYAGQMQVNSLEKAKHMDALQRKTPINQGNRYLNSRR